jgi:hypothetical protein
MTNRQVNLAASMAWAALSLCACGDAKYAFPAFTDFADGGGGAAPTEPGDGAAAPRAGDQKSTDAGKAIVDDAAPPAPADDAAAGVCDEQSCAGCCDGQGICQIAESDTACGAGGSTCTDCSVTNQTCQASACASSSPSSSGTGSDDNGGLPGLDAGVRHRDGGFSL